MRSQRTGALGRRKGRVGEEEQSREIEDEEGGEGVAARRSHTEEHKKISWTCTGIGAAAPLGPEGESSGAQRVRPAGGGRRSRGKEHKEKGKHKEKEGGKANQRREEGGGAHAVSSARYAARTSLIDDIAFTGIVAALPVDGSEPDTSSVSLCTDVASDDLVSCS